MFPLQEILLDGIKNAASDIHISVGSFPIFRLNGSLVKRDYVMPVSPTDMEDIMQMMLSTEEISRFSQEKEYDFSFELNYGAGEQQRFRANYSYSRGRPALSLRIISQNIRTVEQLCLPEQIRDVAKRNNGLFLVTGPTGSGKSTTQAAIVHEINMSRQVHIDTVEDPIEYVFNSERSLIHQREIGFDTKTFAEALRRAMRQDPDVIMIGEMRDLETITAAVTAAETGHLVLATLHTPDAPQSIDRIIDVYPPHQQQQIRIQLASILIGVLSQQLIPMALIENRIVGTEFMMANNAVRNHIREGKTAQIKSTIQTGAGFGMHSMDQDLARLVKEGQISRKTAVSYSYDLKDLERFLGE